MQFSPSLFYSNFWKDFTARARWAKNPTVTLSVWLIFLALNIFFSYEAFLVEDTIWLPFPPINLFLNLFDKISNFVLSDSSEPRSLLLWINHFSVTRDSLKVGLTAHQHLTDMIQVLVDWFLLPVSRLQPPVCNNFARFPILKCDVKNDLRKPFAFSIYCHPHTGYVCALVRL